MVKQIVISADGQFGEKLSLPRNVQRSQPTCSQHNELVQSLKQKVFVSYEKKSPFQKSRAESYPSRTKKFIDKEACLSKDLETSKKSQSAKLFRTCREPLINVENTDLESAREERNTNH